jgi:hypothetical protein
MKNKFIWSILVLFILGSGAVFAAAPATDYYLRFKQLHIAGGGYQPNDFEVGSRLLRLEAEVYKGDGADDFTGYRGDIGTPGFVNTKVQVYNTRYINIGVSWNPGFNTPGGATSAPGYVNAAGSVVHTRVANTGSSKSIGTTPVSLYGVDFELIDNDANASPNNEIEWEVILGSQNAVWCNFSDTQRLHAEENFVYNIEAAQPPQNFDGTGVTAANTYTGNQIEITYPALNNGIGINDLTPYMSYDFYRATNDTPGLDENNRIRTDVTPDSSFGYTGATETVFDGEENGVPVVPPGPVATALSDGTEYWYQVGVKDNTTDNDIIGRHKMIHTHVVGPITPTDTTAPAPPTIGTMTPGDTTLDFPVTAPGAADLDKVIVLMKANEPPDVLSFTSGTGTNHGSPPPNLGDMIAGAEVIHAGGGGPISLQGLENGVMYHFAALANDVADDGNPPTLPRQQGNNWSDVTRKEGTPGKAPLPVRNFTALPSPEVGQITLSWDKPVETYWGGMVFFFTNDSDAMWDWYVDWDPNNALVGVFPDQQWLDLRDQENIGVLAVYNTDDLILAGERESLVISGDVHDVQLDLEQVYYIKAVSFNKTSEEMPQFLAGTDLGAHLFSASLLAATIPAGGAGGGPQTYEFSRGLNDFAILNVPATIDITMPNETTPTTVSGVETIKQLVDAFQGNAATVGYMEAGVIKGYSISPDGSYVGTEGMDLAGDGSDPLVVGPYQVFVSLEEGQTMMVTIR